METVTTILPRSHQICSLKLSEVSGQDPPYFHDTKIQHDDKYMITPPFPQLELSERDHIFFDMIHKMISLHKTMLHTSRL